MTITPGQIRIWVRSSIRVYIVVRQTYYSRRTDSSEWMVFFPDENGFIDSWRSDWIENDPLISPDPLAEIEE